MAQIIDISRPLFECETYPGDSKPRFARVKTVAADGFCLTDMTLCVHNGTHVDAPMHFIDDGAGVGDLPLDAFYGKCVVKAWDGSIPQGCERLLLRGGHSLTATDAELIARSGVRLLGVEGLSVGEGETTNDVHMTLLGAGVIPLEGLALTEVRDGEYVLSAMPLNLGKCDGSPVRAVLIEGIL
ncbi:MAG: cyclase family protein [Clostridiales Family XIII bacterium]|jgi:arylformamidase|nr:cyclase family protein [Clostridiales Family XIII bacterium]